MKSINTREIQNNLARHHFNLLTNVTALVDTSPPYSMYNSPKILGIHYRPLIKKKAQSTDCLYKQGQKTQKSMMQSSQQVLYSTTNSHNIFASKNAATNQSLILNKKMPSTKAYNERLMMVESKLLNLDCYQRAYKTKNNLKKFKSESLSSNDSSKSSKNSNDNHQTNSEYNFNNSQITRLETSTPKPSSFQKLENNYYSKNDCKSINEYQKFKEKALNRILLRRVFTTDAIKDCFNRQIEQNSNLNLEEMQKIMEETMLELGAKNLNDKVEVEKSTRSNSTLYNLPLSNFNESQLLLQQKKTE